MADKPPTDDFHRRIKVEKQRVVARQRRGPQDIIGRKAGVEIVDLRRKHTKVKLTLIEVKSDEHKPRWEKAAIDASVGSQHEAGIDIEEKRIGVPGICVGPGAGPLDFGLADVAVEISNRGRLAARVAGGSNRVVRGSGRIDGPREVKVEERTTDRVRISPGNWLGVAASGPGRSGHEQPGPQGTESPRCYP